MISPGSPVSGDRSFDETAPVRGGLETSPAIRERMRKQRNKNTSPERQLRSELHRLGLRFRVNRRVAGLKSTTPDVVFPVELVAIFVDGCFWHACPVHQSWPKNNAEFWKTKIEGNSLRDKRNEEFLAASGWLPLRVWEHEEPQTAAARVRELVLARRQAHNDQGLRRHAPTS